ncbi:SRPBCC family protein [Streptacidiphilus sp. MAP5-52]|uniref:SRPBCC family protein n=1 Tax=Streptacidiphilus sp. MAP5-52 TaxID=3156267 RepID=UPI0035137335
MARISLSRTVDLPADVCWRRVTDWDRHGDRVPFTRVFVAEGSGRECGDVIVARTGIGALGFDDAMEIAELRAPEQVAGDDESGFCRLVKRGRVVRGWAELSVVPVRGASLTEVRWEEEIRVVGVPRFADPLVGAVGRVVFGRALEHLLRGVPR